MVSFSALWGEWVRKIFRVWRRGFLENAMCLSSAANKNVFSVDCSMAEFHSRNMVQLSSCQRGSPGLRTTDVQPLTSSLLHHRGANAKEAYGRVTRTHIWLVAASRTGGTTTTSDISNCRLDHGGIMTAMDKVVAAASA